MPKSEVEQVALGRASVSTRDSVAEKLNERGREKENKRPVGALLFERVPIESELIKVKAYQADRRARRSGQLLGSHISAVANRKSFQLLLVAFSPANWSIRRVNCFSGLQLTFDPSNWKPQITCFWLRATEMQAADNLYCVPASFGLAKIKEWKGWKIISQAAGLIGGLITETPRLIYRTQSDRTRIFTELCELHEWNSLRVFWLALAWSFFHFFFRKKSLWSAVLVKQTMLGSFTELRCLSHSFEKLARAHTSSNFPTTCQQPKQDKGGLGNSVKG